MFYTKHKISYSFIQFRYAQKVGHYKIYLIMHFPIQSNPIIHILSVVTILPHTRRSMPEKRRQMSETRKAVTIVRDKKD